MLKPWLAYVSIQTKQKKCFCFEFPYIAFKVIKFRTPYMAQLLNRPGNALSLNTLNKHNMIFLK